MLKDKGKSFIFLTCPVCQGSGREGNEECLRCSEEGGFAWLEGNFLHWRKKIDSLHIFEEEIEKLVKNLINGFLILFGVIGIIALLITFIQFSEKGIMLRDIISTRSKLMAIFSLTVISDLYAYYRMQRQSALEEKVIPYQFERVLTVENPDQIFKQALAARKDKKIEVSSSYSQPAYKIVQSSWQLARRFGNYRVQPIHIFASLLSDGSIRVVMGRLGVRGQDLVGKISRSLQRLPRQSQLKTGISWDFKKVLLGAYADAYYSRQSKVQPVNLFTSLIKNDSLSREIMFDLGIKVEEIINVAEWINIRKRLAEKWTRWRNKASFRSKGVMNKSMTAVATPLLDRFSHDLTQLARRGALEPCIGRDREIEETLRVMESGKNVVLVGNPGVGKTSIIEGISELMASDEVPEIMQDKRLISLSVASLVGAAGRQGELEGLLLQIINEIVRAGNIILFIDNIQNMVGVSTEGAENLDISDILASALQKRLFYCLATTTPLDYRRYIETSGSLTSVFQNVKIEEMDENGAIKVLEGKAAGVEAKNQVYFSYLAIDRIVKLTNRYIQDKYLPEKAITILEEVGIYARKKRGKNSIVTPEDVAEVISSKTNVPVTKISEKETEKLLNLEDKIHQRLVNQEEAVKAVSTALRRARTELRDINRPIVNLLFLGPTGVGKTELAKTVASVYFNSEDDMIRLDMSEYQEKSSINRLIGAPPGYSGSAQGGYLTEAVRAKPFSLVLLDEIEKAHPDILNVFLQVMDDGRLTDTLGRTIDFTNTIIIATSNAGTQIIQERVKQNVSLEAIKDELINSELKPYFRPEFLNRFDNILLFKPLTFEHIVKIVGLMLNKVKARLEEKGVHLEATKEAIEELAKEGFDPVFGARPLRRAIQDKVDDALAKYLLQGKIGRRDIAVLEPGGRISIKKAPLI